MKKKNKKRGGKKTARRRGRRVGGFGGGIPMDALGGFAGFVAAKALNGVTRNIQFIQDKPIVLPLIKIIGGYFAHEKAREPFVRNMGLGAIIQGGSDALEVLAPNVFKKLGGDVNGIGTVIDLDDNPLSGYDDMQVEHAVAGAFEYDEISGAI